jgi:predicted DNA binding CopG/RHH family protein
MQTINSAGKKYYYIQRKDNRDTQTVDQFETRKEAREMLAEYQLSDKSATYYISSRPCAGWSK